MSNYTFTVRKGGFEISLVTDDRNAIEQQIAIWVLAVSRKPLIQRVSEEPVSEAEQFTGAECTKEDIQENNEHNDVSGFGNPEEVFIPNEHQEPNAEEHFVPQEQFCQPEPVQTEESIEQEQMNVADRVEEFVNTLDKTDILPQPESAVHNEGEGENTVTINNLFNAENQTGMDFAAILEHSVDNLSSGAVVKKDENFCKLVKANNITDRLELLLFTADYFCKYDAKFTFSLKQINGKLMHNLAVIVDHGILKIALDNNYIERSGESEYRLTEYGRSEIYSKAGIWS